MICELQGRRPNWYRHAQALSIDWCTDYIIQIKSLSLTLGGVWVLKYLTRLLLWNFKKPITNTITPQILHYYYYYLQCKKRKPVQITMYTYIYVICVCLCMWMRVCVRVQIYSYSTLSCQCEALHILNIFIFVCIYFCMCIKCCAQSDSISP